MIPAIKRQTLKEGYITFNKIKCFGDKTVLYFAKEYLRSFLNIEVTFLDKTEANTVFIYKDDLKQGAYRLSIEEKILIEYKDKESVRNSLATLLQLIVPQEEANYVLRCQNIEDYTDCNYRSVMIDLARGLPDKDRLKEDIKCLSLAKCNKLHLHLMDSLGICYVSDVFATDNIRGTGLYSKEDLKSLVVFCNGLGIDVIPEIEIPAHARYLLSKYPQLKCQTESENPSDWVVCAGNEETYVFFERLIVDICDIFSSEYVHIGGDEHAFYDLPQTNRRRNWHECKVCRERMKKEGIDDERGLFYYLVGRMQKILERYGKKIILWNDEIDISKPVPLSRDCIIQFWRIANEHRGPRRGCSYDKFLEQGFQVICSPFEYCYIDLEEYANPEKAASFDYKAYGNSVEYEDKVYGCEACAWEYGNPEYTHYTLSFAPAAVLLLAKMWDRRSVVYDKTYRRELSKLILGSFIPTDYDMFELFGSIMPSRINGTPSYVCKQNELIDQETLLYHESVLKGIPYTYGNFYVKTLLNHIAEAKK